MTCWRPRRAAQAQIAAPTTPSPIQRLVGHAAAENGSGTILAIAIMMTVVVVATLIAPLYMVFLLRQFAAGSADAAALAAADVVSGYTSGVPCEMAERLAIANRTALTACEVDGFVVTVRVKIVVFALQVSASATAGPPGA